MDNGIKQFNYLHGLSSLTSRNKGYYKILYAQFFVLLLKTHRKGIFLYSGNETDRIIGYSCLIDKMLNHVASKYICMLIIFVYIAAKLNK